MKVLSSPLGDAQLEVLTTSGPVAVTPIDVGTPGGSITPLTAFFFVDPTKASATPDGSIANPWLTSQDAINAYPPSLNPLTLMYGSPDSTAVTVPAGVLVQLIGTLELGSWTFTTPGRFLGIESTFADISAGDGFEFVASAAFEADSITAGNSATGTMTGIIQGNEWSFGTGTTLTFNGLSEVSELGVGDGSIIKCSGSSALDSVDMGATCLLESDGLFVSSGVTLGDGSRFRGTGRFEIGVNGINLSGNGGRVNLTGQVGCVGDIQDAGNGLIVLVGSHFDEMQVNNIVGVATTTVYLTGLEAQGAITAGTVSLFDVNYSGNTISVLGTGIFLQSNFSAATINTAPGVFLQMQGCTFQGGVTINNQNVAGSLVVDPWTHYWIGVFGVAIAFPAQVVVAS
jgi:hypothetical protein